MGPLWGLASSRARSQSSSFHVWKTSVTTEILSPFQGMEIGDSISEKQMNLDAPALLVSCGLAMRRFDQ